MGESPFTAGRQNGMVKGRGGDSRAKCRNGADPGPDEPVRCGAYHPERARVIRTYNSPVGDFAEWLVSQKLGLRLEKNSARGLDATGSDGLRYQIKCRWERTDFPTPQSRELGVIRSLEKNQFDFLIAVIFDSHFQVRAAYQIPHEIIPRYAVYRRHVNGHILLVDGPILRDPATKDITHLLR